MLLKPKRQMTGPAFTLVETLVATAIVGIFFVGLYSGITQSFGILANAREDLRANQILLDKMEEMRLYSWDQITSFGTSNAFIPARFTEEYVPSGTNSASTTFSADSSRTQADTDNFLYYGTVLVTNVSFTNSYSTNMRRVLVTLSWTNGAKEFNHQMSTLVSEYGMQKYIY